MSTGAPYLEHQGAYNTPHRYQTASPLGASNVSPGLAPWLGHLQAIPYMHSPFTHLSQHGAMHSTASVNVQGDYHRLLNRVANYPDVAMGYMLSDFKTLSKTDLSQVMRSKSTSLPSTSDKSVTLNSTAGNFLPWVKSLLKFATTAGHTPEVLFSPDELIEHRTQAVTAFLNEDLQQRTNRYNTMCGAFEEAAKTYAAINARDVAQQNDMHKPGQTPRPAPSTEFPRFTKVPTSTSSSNAQSPAPKLPTFTLGPSTDPDQTVNYDTQDPPDLEDSTPSLEMGFRPDMNSKSMQTMLTAALVNVRMAHLEHKQVHQKAAEVIKQMTELSVRTLLEEMLKRMDPTLRNFMQKQIDEAGIYVAHPRAVLDHLQAQSMGSVNMTITSRLYNELADIKYTNEGPFKTFKEFYKTWQGAYQAWEQSGGRGTPSQAKTLFADALPDDESSHPVKGGRGFIRLIEQLRHPGDSTPLSAMATQIEAAEQLQMKKAGTAGAKNKTKQESARSEVHAAMHSENEKKHPRAKCTHCGAGHNSSSCFSHPDPKARLAALKSALKSCEQNVKDGKPPRMNIEDVKGRMSKTQDEIENGTQKGTTDVAELTKLVKELAASHKSLLERFDAMKGPGKTGEANTVTLAGDDVEPEIPTDHCDNSHLAAEYGSSWDAEYRSDADDHYSLNGMAMCVTEAFHTGAQHQDGPTIDPPGGAWINIPKKKKRNKKKRK
jgi:hypothetical protein